MTQIDNCINKIVNYYRPQTKFAKVMFLHLSVSHSVHRGEYLGGYTPRQVHLSWAGTPPGQVHPLGRYTPFGRYTPLGQVHPPGRYTPPEQVHPLGRLHPLWWVHPSPGQVHPPAGTPTWAGTPPLAGTPPGAVHAGRYGQQAGGTHPTGMHSCLGGK